MSRYEIVVEGSLSDTLLAGFPELVVVSTNGRTHLIGDVTDQPALHDVLSRIASLNLTLLECRRVHP